MQSVRLVRASQSIALIVGAVLALANAFNWAQTPSHAALSLGDGQPIGFTGYVKDPESGLYYAGARYYDPAIGRFVTEDPESGSPMNPPSLHRYLYAYANPATYTDSTGRQVDIDDPVLVAKNQGWNEEQTATAVAAHVAAEEFRSGAAYGAGKQVVRGAYGVAAWGTRLLAKTFLDVGDPKDIVDPIINGVVGVADAIRSGPNALVEYEAHKSVESEALVRQGRIVEAGELYGPEVATTVGGVATAAARAGALGDLSLEGVVLERADGQVALASQRAVAGTANVGGFNLATASDAPASVVQSRIDELRAAIPENSRGRITMASAVVEDASGQRAVLIGTSEPRGYLRPGVKLKPGEQLVVGTGHAETDILSHATKNELKIISIGATRPVCVDCQNAIRPTSAEIVTPVKKPKPDSGTPP